MIDVNKAGGIVLNTKNNILIITNDIHRLTLPKGSIEDNESFEQAAEREVLEESGLRHVSRVKKFGVLIRPGYTDDNHEVPSVTKHIHMYLFKTDEFDLNPNVKDIISAQWVTFEEAIKILSWDEEKQFLIQYKESLFDCN